jgi:hypothetical protein
MKGCLFENGAELKTNGRNVLSPLFNGRNVGYPEHFDDQKWMAF